MTDHDVVRPQRAVTARALAWIAVVLGFGWATSLWAMRFFGTKHPVHEAEWWIGDAALASVFALPAVIGLIALKRREELFVGAAVLSLVLSAVLLVSVATLPLVIPGVLFLVAARRVARKPERAGRVAAVTLVVLGIAVGALVVLIFAPRTVVCWHETEYTDGTTLLARDYISERQSSDGSVTMTGGPPTEGVLSDGGGCTDGVFPPARSLVALGMVASVVLVAWRAA